MSTYSIRVLHFVPHSNLNVDVNLQALNIQLQMAMKAKQRQLLQFLWFSLTNQIRGPLRLRLSLCQLIHARTCALNQLLPMNVQVVIQLFFRRARTRPWVLVNCASLMENVSCCRHAQVEALLSNDDWHASNKILSVICY